MPPLATLEKDYPLSLKGLVDHGNSQRNLQRIRHHRLRDQPPDVRLDSIHGIPG